MKGWIAYKDSATALRLDAYASAPFEVKKHFAG